MHNDITATKTYPNSRVLLQQHHIQSMNQSWVVASFHFLYDGLGIMPMTHMFSHPLTDRLVLKRPITTVVKYSLATISYELELTVQ